jgi:hypothetical protein
MARKSAVVVDPDDTPPVGLCRIETCGRPTWMVDDLGPAHPCCVLNEKASPGDPCVACRSASGTRRR